MKESPYGCPLQPYTPYSLNVGGRLFEMDGPQVMGIVNATPDSFYAPSRTTDESAVTARVRQILAEGGTMIDVGACSTRPGATAVDAAEEAERLRRVLPVVMREAGGAVVSVDTYRADVARMCVEEYGVHIINDISGGTLDAAMLPTVAALGVPYVLMHMGGGADAVSHAPVMESVCTWLAGRVRQLHELGAHDVILDPGFGFGKSMTDNFRLLRHLSDLSLLGLPLLVGLSRKRMAWQTLEASPATALNGTTILNTVALMQGAHILRVHDVRAAAEAVRLVSALRYAGTDHPTLHP